MPGSAADAKDSRLALSMVANGCIRYPNGRDGRLILVKNHPPMDAPRDVVSYAETDRNFPMHSPSISSLMTNVSTPTASLAISEARRLQLRSTRRTRSPSHHKRTRSTQDPPKEGRSRNEIQLGTVPAQHADVPLPMRSGTATEFGRLGYRRFRDVGIWILAALRPVLLSDGLHHEAAPCRDRPIAALLVGRGEQLGRHGSSAGLGTLVTLRHARPS